MLANQTEVLDLIPQRHPMVMVDRLIECEEKYALSGLKIKADNIFCVGGTFSEPGVIEHIAQTAALQNGYLAQQNREPVKVGFIGAVKKFKLNRLPSAQEVLQTRIENTHSFENISIVRATVQVNQEIIAETELSIFIQD